MSVKTSTQGALIQALDVAEPSSRTTDSPYDKLHNTCDHLHSSAKIYPTLAAGVTVTGAVGAWTLGSYAEIVPASTITDAFDVHWIVVESVSASGIYELVLYAATTEIGRVRFSVVDTAQGSTISPIPFICPIQAANTQIQAKVASSSGGSDTIDISIFYHTY